MEYLITASILGLGYIYSNDKKKSPKTFKQSKKSKISNSQKPSSYNYYSNNSAFNIFQNEQKYATKLFDKSLYPKDTNIVTPGPPYPIINNKVDYTDKTLPIEFNSTTDVQNINLTNIDSPGRNMPDGIVSNKREPESGGFQGISLTGNQIEPNDFTHNNMQPFFGSTIRQNLDEFSTRGIMENFTGTNDNYQKKQETKQFFQPQKNMSNVYGSQNLDGYMLDRYSVSRYRENETPIEKVYVGPGLNKGYTNEGSGGFQQAETRDYITPKTTDEIRVKTNPKISYYGRINAGEKISKPTKIGTVYKNRPDTFYVQNADRLLTTTGQIIAPEQRPCIINRYTNRKTTGLKSREGPAAPTHGSVAQVRSKYKVSHKVTYKYDDPVNKTSNDQWSILNLFSSAPNDYGKKSIRLRNNKKLPVENKNYKLNYKSETEMGPSRSEQKIKKPKKYSTIKNKRQGNLKGATNNVIYDPNDVARTTIKEQNIDNNFRSNASVSTRGNVVYDPENIARTTIKETNIDNNREGNVGTSKRGNYIKNNEKAKKTIKQSTMVEDALGMASEPRNDAYLSTDVQAVGTQRMTTSVEYFGDADGPELGAYDVTEVDAKKTKKQETSDIEYTGNAGNDGRNTAPMSYSDIYNSTIKAIRGDLDDGYTPGASGPNKIVSGNDIHATTNKLGEIQNQYLNERGTQATKIYNSIPQIELSNITQNKDTVPNQPLADRINPDMIKAYQENPYTQSLKSWA